MADQEVIQDQEVMSPADEAVSSRSDTAEIEVPGAPATPDEETEIAALEALDEAIEAAPDAEAKKIAVAKRRAAWAKMRTGVKESEAKVREEAAFLRGQVEVLQKVPAAAPTVTAPAAPVVPELVLPPEPRLEDFDDGDGGYDYHKFYAATGRWGAQCEFIKRDADRAVEERRQKQEQADKNQQNWTQQGEAKFPGFKAKVESRMVPILNTLSPEKFQALTGALSDSPVSHDLAVYLSDNPSELRRLADLPSLFAAIKEIGYLEKKLEKPKPKTTTGAPAPIVPVQTGGEAVTDIMQLDGDDYLAAVKAKVSREGRGALYK